MVEPLPILFEHCLEKGEDQALPSRMYNLW